jgi:hypothetical protein
MRTVESGIWKKILKTCKMREKYCRTRNMGKKLKNIENERKIL